jgi:hypothetical protein
LAIFSGGRDPPLPLFFFSLLLPFWIPSLFTSLSAGATSATHELMPELRYLDFV